MQQSLESSFYAHVELIRRGLPTLVVQAEYLWAMNTLPRIYSRFRSRSSLSFCRSDYAWGRLFDHKDRSWYSMDYMRNLRVIKPNINFLSDDEDEYPSIPPMNSDQQSLVDSMWQTHLQKFQTTPRGYYNRDDLPFPTNVAILYDPYQDAACDEYHKFGSVNGPGTMQADEYIVLLIAQCIRLHRMDPSASSLARIIPMLRHFVAYTFNGVRCLLSESIGIPLSLQRAYGSNVASILGAISAPRPVPHVSTSAVKYTFKNEITDITSYTSWGNLEYSILSPIYDIPRVVDVTNILFDYYMYQRLLSYSSRMVVTTSERDGDDVTCNSGYVPVDRNIAFENPEEECCAQLCLSWITALHATRISMYACCERCNQASCPRDSIVVDIVNWIRTTFQVPSYGDAGNQTIVMI